MFERTGEGLNQSLTTSVHDRGISLPLSRACLWQLRADYCVEELTFFFIACISERSIFHVRLYPSFVKQVETENS